MSPVWAAVAMLVQNVLAVFLVQAEARNPALLAGLLDCLPGRKSLPRRGGIAMDDADLQQAAREDLRWEPRVDAAHVAPSGGLLRIVVGYDVSAPASPGA